MVRVRIAGPRSLLDTTLTVVQDLGVLHIDRPPVPESAMTDHVIARQRRHVERSLADVETALARLEVPGDTQAHGDIPASAPEAVRRARRVRRRADALTVTRASLEEQRSLLLRYGEFFRVFEALAGYELTWPDGQVFYVVLKAGAESVLPDLKRRLDEAVGGEVELLSRELSSGEWAVLILASARAAPRV
jgi:vacuolar-type H+-ATPase subunit I/STV1